MRAKTFFAIRKNVAKVTTKQKIIILHRLYLYLPRALYSARPSDAAIAVDKRKTKIAAPVTSVAIFLHSDKLEPKKN